MVSLQIFYYKSGMPEYFGNHVPGEVRPVISNPAVLEHQEYPQQRIDVDLF